MITFLSGSALITICKDGLFRASTDVITHSLGPQARNDAVHAMGSNEIEADINCFLIERPDGPILIDAGIGDAWGPSFGNARRILRKRGVTPASIRYVLVTHIHHDHVLGLFNGEAPYFPNAQIIVPSDEVTFLRGLNGAGPYAPLWKKLYAAYEAPRIQLIAPEQVIEGVKAIGLPGHSPGHTGYLLEGGDGPDVFFCGDVIHLADFQIQDPEIGLNFDHDPVSAILSRRKCLEMASLGNWVVAGSHISGLHHIQKSTAGFSKIKHGQERKNGKKVSQQTSSLSQRD